MCVCEGVGSVCMREWVVCVCVRGVGSVCVCVCEGVCVVRGWVVCV